MIDAGLIISNQLGNLLIGSIARSFLFWGKANREGVVSSGTQAGGYVRVKFTVTCPYPPVPFFTMPIAEYHATTSIQNVSGNNWEIEVTRSNGANLQDYALPEVYVFCEARAFEDQLAFKKSGLRMFMPDGSLAFDSNFLPMALSDVVLVSPPPNPVEGIPGADYNADSCLTSNFYEFQPGFSENNFPLSSIVAKPIYFYNSLAQAERETAVERSESSCFGLEVLGNCLGWEGTKTWISNYWAFYRSGIRRNVAAQSIGCGWITTSYGCHYTYSGEQSLFGIGVNGSDGSGGAWPYSNETLNLEPVYVMMASGIPYG